MNKNDLQKKVTEVGDQVHKKVQKEIDKAKKEMHNMLSKVELFARKNPAKAAIIAAHAGALVGATVTKLAMKLKQHEGKGKKK